MARLVTGGLIQCANPINDESRPVAEIQAAMLEKHLGLMRDVVGEPLTRLWRNGVKQMEVFQKPWFQVLREALGPIYKDKQALIRVTMMLDGELPLSGEEGRAAVILRQSFYGEYPGEGLHGEFGFEYKQFRDPYAPHWRMGAYGQEDVVGRGLPESIAFPAERQRVAEDTPREMDALKLALAYLRAGSRKLFLEPILKADDPFVEMMAPSRREWYAERVNEILGTPMGEEQEINQAIKNIFNPILAKVGREIQDPRPARTLSIFVTDAAYMGTIGGNLASVLKNLTQQFLIPADLSPNLLEGIYWWMRGKIAGYTPTGRELLKSCWVLQNRIHFEGFEMQQQPFQGVVGMVKKAAYWLYNVAEAKNVKDAYLSRAVMGLAKGESIDDAIEAGNMTAARTQYLFGVVDSPRFARTPLGRILGQFYSWQVNWLRMEYQYATTPGERIKVINSLIMMYLGAYVATKVTQISFRSTYPHRQFMEWYPLAWARGERSITPETIKRGVELGVAEVERDPEAIDKAKEAFKDQLKNYIPVHAQWVRVARFIDAATNEWKVYDARGRLQYETTPGEAFRGLFGTTVEQEARYAESQRIARQEYQYQTLRRKAIDAYFNGDISTFNRLNGELLQKYGKMIRGADLKELRKSREQPALERQRQGLPAGVR